MKIMNKLLIILTFILSLSVIGCGDDYVSGNGLIPSLYGTPSKNDNTSNEDDPAQGGTPSQGNDFIKPSIAIDSLSYTKDSEVSARATINNYNKYISEAGFIVRKDGYDLTLTSNYNDNTTRITCEIISNSISIVKYPITGFGSGAYARAYLIMSDGTIIYNGDKIYVASGFSYPRD